MSLQKKHTEEETFERLKRAPFIEVVDMAAQYVWPGITLVDARARVLTIWGMYEPGMPVNEPTDKWLADQYKEMGWTLKELFEEAVEYVHMDRSRRIAK